MHAIEQALILLGCTLMLVSLPTLVWRKYAAYGLIGIWIAVAALSAVAVSIRFN